MRYRGMAFALLAGLTTTVISEERQEYVPFLCSRPPLVEEIGRLINEAGKTPSKAFDEVEQRLKEKPGTGHCFARQYVGRIIKIYPEKTFNNGQQHAVAKLVLFGIKYHPAPDKTALHILERPVYAYSLLYPVREGEPPPPASVPIPEPEGGDGPPQEHTPFVPYSADRIDS